jgi:hypothetical protein
MMKINRQQLIRAVGFLLLFCLLFSYGSAVMYPNLEDMEYSRNTIHTFYEQPKDSIDVIFLGSSSFLYGISPLILWEKYGFTSFSRSSTVQSAVVSYYYLLETLKTQHPKVVVIDGISLFKEYNVDDREYHLRKAIDPMKLSGEKIRLVLDIVSKSENQTLASYIFPLLRFHSRWDEVTIDDFINLETIKYDPFRGYVMDFRINPRIFPENFMKPTKKISKNDEDSIHYLDKIIQLCKENEIKVVFATLPRLSWNYSRHLAIKQLAEKYDSPYIDYNLPAYIDEMGINPASDFWDNNHLNVYGAQKTSNYLGLTLQKMYGFPDKRNNPDYEQWDIDVQYFYDQLTQEQAKAPGGR